MSEFFGTAVILLWSFFWLCFDSHTNFYAFRLHSNVDLEFDFLKIRMILMLKLFNFSFCSIFFTCFVEKLLPTCLLLVYKIAVDV